MLASTFFRELFFTFFLIGLQHLEPWKLLIGTKESVVEHKRSTSESCRRTLHAQFNTKIDTIFSLILSECGSNLIIYSS